MKNNNKIALLTFNSSCNYGTLLQAYALARKIKDLGYECEYIKYKPEKKKTILRRCLGSIKKHIFSLIKDKKSSQGIDDFYFWDSKDFKFTKNKCKQFSAKYIPTSIEYFKDNIDVTNNIYDRFIVGSDQTWSPHIIKESSPFLLRFVKDNKKKYSYGPSLGTLSIPPSFSQTINNYIKTFNIITCREKTNCVQIEKIINKPVYHVLDPTLLLSKAEWLSISTKTNNKMPDKYILCYILGEKECISNFAEQLGIKEKIPVFYIYTRPFYANKTNILKNIGPQEFITLLANASCLITDSFHGTIFAINFHINFYTFTKRTSGNNSHDNDRILEILNTFELTDRYKEDSSIATNINNIDFSKPQALLNKLKINSLNILKKELA